MLELIFANLKTSDRFCLGGLPIRVPMIAAISLLLLSGCVNENRQKIVGSWTMIKADRLAQRVNEAPESSEDGSAESLETTSAQPAAVEAELPMMTLDFRNSGQLVTTTKLGKINSAKNGRWRMVNFDPPSTMNIECFLDEQSDQARQLEVKWIDDQTIRLTPPNMSGQKMKINFKKQ